MIKKLQRRFIRIALTALAVAMIAVVVVVNAANWFSVRNDLVQTLSFITEKNSVTSGDRLSDGLTGKKNRHARNLVSESSWFSVSFDGSGAQRNIELSAMTDADEQEAASLAALALQSGRNSGFLQDYLYQVVDSVNGGKTVVFLNCETRLTAVRTLALFSGLACLAGILLAWLFVSLASRKAIEPTVRNMEQQKQFITNASHELKTPLTVISANMELLQMEQPDNPWVISTRKQTAQLRHLVDELVYLSRMEEANTPMTMEDLPLNSLIQEAAEPFAAMAEYQGKSMEVHAENGLTLRGDRASIQRLLSTLLDNAVKYAPPEGTIRVDARSEGRHVLLTVSNDVAQPLTDDQCRQLFNRFYRADLSRNKDQKSGFGIGLAIAAAIAEKHGGAISAFMGSENRLAIACRLPK